MDRTTLETIAGRLLPLRGRTLAGAGTVSPLEVLLRFSGPPGPGSRLLLSLRPDRPGLFPVPEGVRLPLLPSPSPFCAAAEGRLRGGGLEGVALPIPGERVVTISFSAPWPRRGPGGALLLEVMGRSGNLYLLDPEGRILAPLRPLPPGNRRGLAPGARWTAPPPGGGTPRKANPLDGHRFPTLEEAAWAWRESASGTPAAPPDPLAGLREELARRVARADREVERLAGEEARCQDAPGLRRMAEALLASPPPPPGAASVTLPHPASPGEPLTIGLDPALSAGGNADRLFAEAKRMDRGAALLARRREKAVAERGRLAAAAEALEEGNPAPAERITGAAGRHGRKAAPAVPPDARPAWKGPGKRHQRDGFAILVGKGAEDNERVTFEAAGPSDLWLHARDWPGSHVVVLAEGRPVPEPVVRYAAGLAAERSGGKGSGSVEVTVAERKWVRKIKGGKPGLVQVERSRSVRVRKNRDGEWE